MLTLKVAVRSTPGRTTMARQVARCACGFGAVASGGDPCLYYKGQGEDITLIAVYVDNILVASRNHKSVDQLGRIVSNPFEVKDLGPVDYCLGVKFCNDGHRITMSQRSYINDFLIRFNMTEAKSVSTPMDIGARLIKKSEPVELDEDIPYRELVKCLPPIWQ